MASLCGFTFLAIFPSLFFYDEAVRRDADDEASSSDESSEVSSDLLELRDARIDAKVVRSHDASLFFKKGREKCSVNVADTTCELEGLFSSSCCELFQVQVCVQSKEYNASWTSCDEFKFDEAFFQNFEKKKNSCSREEAAAMKKNTCVQDAGKSEEKKGMEQLTFDTTPVCPLKKVSEKVPYDCELEWLSPACCERHQAFWCDSHKHTGVVWTLCDNFKGKEFQDWSACSETDKLALKKNTFFGKCVPDADGEASSSDESSEVPRVSSDLLELREARTDAKLVRSHDASLFLKKGKEKCSVKLADTTCELKGLFSSKCCEQAQAEVCLQGKKYNKSWTICDKFQESSQKNWECSRGEVAALDKDACLSDAGKSEMEKATQNETTQNETTVQDLPKP